MSNFDTEFNEILSNMNMNNTVAETVNETVEQTINETVNEKADETVNETVEEETVENSEEKDEETVEEKAEEKAEEKDEETVEEKDEENSERDDYIKSLRTTDENKEILKKLSPEQFSVFEKITKNQQQMIDRQAREVGEKRKEISNYNALAKSITAKDALPKNMQHIADCNPTQVMQLFGEMLTIYETNPVELINDICNYHKIELEQLVNKTYKADAEKAGLKASAISRQRDDVLQKTKSELEAQTSSDDLIRDAWNNFITSHAIDEKIHDTMSKLAQSDLISDAKNIEDYYTQLYHAAVKLHSVKDSQGQVEKPTQTTQSKVGHNRNASNLKQDKATINTNSSFDEAFNFFAAETGIRK